MPATLAFDRILITLVRRGVEFILVGGVNAVLHGAPYDTFDVDVVHRRTEDNLAHLYGALDELGAMYRLAESRQLKPPADALAGPGHQLLTTRYGKLDLLGTLDGVLGYDELLPQTEIKDLGDGLVLRMLTLDALIEIKERTGRAKDRWAAELLRAVREERATR